MGARHCFLAAVVFIIPQSAFCQVDQILTSINTQTTRDLSVIASQRQDCTSFDYSRLARDARDLQSKAEEASKKRESLERALDDFESVRRRGDLDRTQRARRDAQQAQDEFQRASRDANSAAEGILGCGLNAQIMLSVYIQATRKVLETWFAANPR
jgi:hypothetical protein